MTESKKIYIMNWVRTIITVVSLILALYSYRSKIQTELVSEAKILQLVDKGLKLEQKNAVFEELIRNLQKNNVLLKSQVAQYQNREDSLIHSSKLKQNKIDNLNKQLNETPEPIDLTDDEHYKFFLEWTKPL